MPTSKKTSHHHGNLRAALIESGITMLEAGETFSLRAVARQVGVSQTAPYRHFSDKEHLEAAMAAHGFRNLQTLLLSTIQQDEENVQIVDLALTYAHYAIAHPALYRLMFGQPCGEDDERLKASTEVFDLIQQVALKAFPDTSPLGLATAGWSLSHGISSLYLDGKLAAKTIEELDERIRGAFIAITSMAS